MQHLFRYNHIHKVNSESMNHDSSNDPFTVSLDTDQNQLNATECGIVPELTLFA